MNATRILAAGLIFQAVIAAAHGSTAWAIASGVMGCALWAFAAFEETAAGLCTDGVKEAKDALEDFRGRIETLEHERDTVRMSLGEAHQKATELQKHLEELDDKVRTLSNRVTASRI